MDGMDIDEQMSTVESSDNNIEDLGQEGQESEEEEEDDDYEIMSYDEVESALGIQTSAIKDIKDTMSSAAGSPETDDDDDAFPSPEDESSASSFEDPGPRDSEDEETQEIKEEAEDDNGSLNREAIERDIEEAMTSIAYTEGLRALPALRSRIRTEHRLERDAERLDLKASAEAEARLWTVLRGDGDAKRK
ncbi:hypothetical protein NPX13_g8058 [Xylaria arbuscula]|uniref:Uncharacterized protein n=1 Tax=Xylaria arbuscula TaxID=114810 RepID=A0A9W8TIP4_9PEZI|nr:hypothetical protein NPX13_g8058 [Xylaria arbuscula]